MAVRLRCSGEPPAGGLRGGRARCPGAIWGALGELYPTDEGRSGQVGGYSPMSSIGLIGSNSCRTRSLPFMGAAVAGGESAMTEARRPP